MIDPMLAFKGFGLESTAGDGGFHARWRVPADLPYFQGHFPGQAIFPAVGIVDATLHALRLHLSSPSLQLVGISSAKFLSPILPQAKVELKFRPVGESQWECEWTEEGHTKPMALLRLTTI